MNLREILSDIDKFLDDRLEEHERRLVRSLRKCEERIINLARRLDTKKDGTIRGPKWTLSQAQEIHAQLKVVVEETFGEAWKSNVADFDDVMEFVEKTYGRMDVPAAFGSVDERMLEGLRAQAFDVYHTMETQTVNRIAQAVYDAVLSGQSFGWLTQHIRAAISGHADIRGRPLSSYAELYAHDLLMDTYASLHKRKAEETGLDHFLYAGNTIRDSRPFCVQRAGKVFSREEIEGWNKLDWEGKAPGDVFIRRGGYNCRHHFLPVKKEWIPKGEVDIQRYKPKRDPNVVYARSEPLTFDTIRNIRDAEEWASQKWPHVQWDFKKAHLDTIKPTLKRLEELEKAHPDVFQKIKYIGTMRNKEKMDKARVPHVGRRFSEFIYAHAGEDYIGLNPHYYGNPTEFLTKLRRDENVGFHPKGSGNYESIITHEFGHVIYHVMGSSRKCIHPVVSAEGRGIIGEYFHRLFGANGKFMAKPDKYISPVSQYALYNEREAFAEAFLEMWASPKSLYSRTIKKFFKYLRENTLYDLDQVIFMAEASQQERDMARELFLRFERYIGLKWQ